MMDFLYHKHPQPLNNGEKQTKNGSMSASLESVSKKILFKRKNYVRVEKITLLWDIWCIEASGNNGLSPLNHSAT